MDKTARRKLLMLRISIQFIIAFLLSLAMTIINFGFTSAFVHNWVKAFVVAFLIIPIAVRLIPIVARGVRTVLGDASPFLLRCVVAICVAAMMESVVAFAVTLAQHGLAAGWPVLWANTFIKALPLGLVIGATMTFIVQPRSSGWRCLLRQLKEPKDRCEGLGSTPPRPRFRSQNLSSTAPVLAVDALNANLA